jgi:hypothetical protein
MKLDPRDKKMARLMAMTLLAAAAFGYAIGCLMFR